MTHAIGEIRLIEQMTRDFQRSSLQLNTLLDRGAEQLIAYSALQAENERLSYMILEVRESNIQAIKLYRHLNFEQVALRRGYYTDTGEDALLMTCQDLASLAARLLIEEE